MIGCLVSCQLVAGLFFVASVWQSRLDWARLLVLHLLFANAVGLAGFVAAASMARLSALWSLRPRVSPIAAAAAAGGIGGLYAARPVAERLLGVRVGAWGGTDVAFVVMLVGGYFFYAAAERRAAEAREALRQREMAELEGLRARAESELRALQSTIEPHFLFNALNSIATLVAEDPARAEAALVRLSRLLRAVVDASREPAIRLERELELVQSYLEIEQIRFEERLCFELEADRALLDVLVPALVLQPLVENAVKHGVGLKRGPGRVQVTCRSEGERGVLEVWDDGVGDGGSGTGLGLDAVRKRLVAAFGASATLELERVAGRTRARVTIPLPGGAHA